MGRLGDGVIVPPHEFGRIYPFSPLTNEINEIFDFLIILSLSDERWTRRAFPDGENWAGWWQRAARRKHTPSAIVEYSCFSSDDNRVPIDPS